MSTGILRPLTGSYQQINSTACQYPSVAKGCGEGRDSGFLLARPASHLGEFEHVQNGTPLERSAGTWRVVVVQDGAAIRPPVQRAPPVVGHDRPTLQLVVSNGEARTGTAENSLLISGVLKVPCSPWRCLHYDLMPRVTGSFNCLPASMNPASSVRIFLAPRFAAIARWSASPPRRPVVKRSTYSRARPKSQPSA